MKNKFKELIEDYAFRGMDIKQLNKEQLYELAVAYVEHKFSSYPWKECRVSDSVDIGFTIEMLRKLGSNLYNSQKQALEEIKTAAIESQISDISEALDEEIEKARHRYSFDDDNEYQHESQFDLFSDFNTTKKYVMPRRISIKRTWGNV